MTWCEKILLALVSSWPLVVVAVWGIVVANRTLKKIALQVEAAYRQADIAEKAANAAKLSADSLINAERAWVVVEDVIFDREGSGALDFHPIVKNVGKTIARIRKISLGGTKPRQTNEELEVPPAYEGEEEIDLVLSPNGELPLLSIPWIRLNKENAQSVREGLLSMYIYGLIEYCDFVGEPRTTAFCLKFHPAREKALTRFYPFTQAPTGYIKAT